MSRASLRPALRQAMRGRGRFGLPYSVAFAALAGLPSVWHAPTWIVSGGAAVNTPTLGAEMLANPGFEGVYVGGVAPNWSRAAGGTATESADAHGGSAAQQFQGAAAGDRVQVAGISAVIGEWYLAQEWYKRVAGAAGDLSFAVYDGSGLLSPGAQTSAAYAQLTLAFRALATILQFRAMQSAGGGSYDTVIADDATLKPITRSTLFATIPATRADVTVVVAPTIAVATQAGVVLNVDSVTDPQNFVLGFIDRVDGKAKLLKCVAGTWTSLISTAISYVAGQTVKVVKSGTTYQLFYNNVQIGADQTIADAGIIGNTVHGMFSTYSGNSIASFSATRS